VSFAGKNVVYIFVTEKDCLVRPSGRGFTHGGGGRVHGSKGVRSHLVKRKEEK